MISHYVSHFRCNLHAHYFFPSRRSSELLYPSSIHEMIEMGLLGIAMSRYSGCWVGMKVITETVETTAEINLNDEMTPFVIRSEAHTSELQSRFDLVGSLILEKKKQINTTT